MHGDEVTLRPIDLGRSAGISTQQVRNYADAGVLPPTDRTPAGYRRFGPRHLEALHTYRALAKGYGAEVATAVMRAVHDDDLPRALELVDASHAALHEQRASLRAAGEALEAIADKAMDTSELPRSDLRIGEVAAHLGVRTSALRVWEAEGLLAPRRDRGTRYRSFSPLDVRDARLIHVLRQGGYPLPQIKPVLDGVRRSGDTAALRDAIARRQAFVTHRARAMLEASCRLHHYAGGGEG